MVAKKGIFDGNNFFALEKVPVSTRSKVIITLHWGSRWNFSNKRFNRPNWQSKILEKWGRRHLPRLFKELMDIGKQEISIKLLNHGIEYEKWNFIEDQ